MEISTRDSFKGRVYTAEREAFRECPEAFPTMADVILFVRKLETRAWFKRAFAGAVKAHIEVKPKPGWVNTAYGANNNGRPYVKLPDSVWGRSLMVVLHEIAHAVTPVQGYVMGWRQQTKKPHGREYCQAYLKLVHHAAPEYEAKLKAAFKKHKVPFRKAPQYSAATLQAMRARAKATFTAAAATKALKTPAMGIVAATPTDVPEGSFIKDFEIKITL